VGGACDVLQAMLNTCMNGLMKIMNGLGLSSVGN
jgi:hypothetical protein